MNGRAREQVLRVVRIHGPLSRKEISRRLPRFCPDHLRVIVNALVADRLLVRESSTLPHLFEATSFVCGKEVRRDR